MARRSSDIIVGLDHRHHQDCGHRRKKFVESGLDVIGVGTHVSRGLKKGVIVNIDSTVAAIKQACWKPKACPVARSHRST